MKTDRDTRSPEEAAEAARAAIERIAEEQVRQAREQVKQIARIFSEHGLFKATNVVGADGNVVSRRLINVSPEATDYPNGDAYPHYLSPDGTVYSALVLQNPETGADTLHGLNKVEPYWYSFQFLHLASVAADIARTPRQKAPDQE